MRFLGRLIVNASLKFDLELVKKSWLLMVDVVVPKHYTYELLLFFNKYTKKLTLDFILLKIYKKVQNEKNLSPLPLTTKSGDIGEVHNTIIWIQELCEKENNTCLWDNTFTG